MKLQRLMTQYISYRKSLGEKFKTNEGILKAFAKFSGPEISITLIDKKMVSDFLYGNQKIVTSGWFVKHTAMLGFYQYTMTRNYVNTKINYRAKIFKNCFSIS